MARREDGQVAGRAVASRLVVGLRGRPGLVGIALALPVAEYLLLQGFGIGSALPLAPQATALAPFQVFHDLRFLFVFHNSWWTFAAELAAIVALRTTLTALFVQLAWPRDLPLPSRRQTVGTALRATLLALIVLTPAATFLFVLAVVPIFPFFVVAFVFAVVPLVPLHGSAYPFCSWRRLPGLRTAAWLVLVALALTLAGLAIAESPRWVGVLPTATAGLFNAYAWDAVVKTVAYRRYRRHSRPPVPLKQATLAVSSAALTAAVGYAIAFATSPGALNEHALQGGARRDGPVLVALGFRSAVTASDLRRLAVERGRNIRLYSYRGLGKDGLPLPYDELDTYQALEGLVAKMALQVEAFHHASGEPIALVGESEGSLVAKLYLLTHPDAPVTEVLLLSPVLEPARVFYPLPGRSGFGVATRLPLRLVAEAIDLTFFPAWVEMPIVRSLIRNAPLLRHGMSCRIVGVPELAFVALSDAVAQTRSPDGETAVVPAIHGKATEAGRVDDALVVDLRGSPPPSFPRWTITARVIRGAAAAWQVPTLPLSLPDPWQPRHRRGRPQDCTV